MPRRLILAWLPLAFACLPAVAQTPFATDLVPTRTALARLGMERPWMAVIPMSGTERLMGLSMAEGMIFAQTNHANFHVLSAETGQPLWTAGLGRQTARALPPSTNSYAVFVTNMNQLYALDRRSGRTLWVHDLGTLPASPTAADEDRVMVGLNNGKIYAYNLKVKTDKQVSLSTRPINLWNWQTGGVISTRPLPASNLVAFGSADGKVYVALADARTMLYRVPTGGPIGAGLGAFGTRLLLAPSADFNLYGIDILTARVLWSFPSGAPIQQEPLVAENDIYVVNTVGSISSVDPNSGTSRWTTSTHGGRLLAVGAKRIYLESADGDLFVVDRASGQIVVDPRATVSRVGLNLRPYTLGLTNRENDRLYFATTSGMVIALRELGQTSPRRLRDPKALPFGYIPTEGVSLTPPAPPAADAAPPPAGEEKPADPGEDKDKPAPDEAKPAAPDDKAAPGDEPK